jgi:hypothetical protein
MGYQGEVDINLVVVHPQLNHNGHPVDGVLVGGLLSPSTHLHTTPFSRFEAFSFRTPGTHLEPSDMGSLAGEQEPNEKKCSVHTPSIHPSMVVCSWVLVHSGRKVSK